MKKNLISIIILALLVINIVLSAVTMFSVTSTNSKTAALVTDIAAAISLDLGTTGTAEEAEETVAMTDVVTYDIDELTIPLKKSEDGTSHVAVISFTLSMNSKNKDYKTYGSGDLSEKESLIKGEISDVVSQYTYEQAGDGSSNHDIEDEILERIQTMFDSKFIYNITMSSYYYQ